MKITQHAYPDTKGDLSGYFGRGITEEGKEVNLFWPSLGAIEADEDADWEHPIILS